MGRDDRERNFEKALARNLRANVASDAPQNMCADAETMAAYHDHLLSSDHMSFWEKHIGSCPRCQEILLQLRAIEDVLTAGYSAAQQPVTPRQASKLATPAHGTKSPVEFAARRRTAWRWMVAPASALAAGLLVWVAVQQKTPVKVSPVEIAKNQQPPASTPDEMSRSTANQEAGAPAAKEFRSREAMPGNTGDVSTAGRTKQFEPLLRKPPSAATRREGGLERLAPSLDSVTTKSSRADKNDIAADEGKSLEKRPGTETFTFAPSASAPGAVPAPNPPPAVNETVEVTAEAVPQGQAPAKKKGLARAADAPATVQQQQEMVGQSLYKVEPAVRLANAKDGTTISAPGGSAQWRVGSAGIIEHSTDAGATWTLQPSGVVADLIAGSAPSDKVCWIAGREGAIVRTTDGGEHWQRIHAPIDSDFVAVFAVNAQQATVSLVQGSYRTIDGGLTWKKLAAE